MTKAMHWTVSGTSPKCSAGNSRGRGLSRHITPNITEVTCKTCLKMFNSKLECVAADIRTDVLGVRS